MPDFSFAKQEQTYIENLTFAASRLAQVKSFRQFFGNDL